MEKLTLESKMDIKNLWFNDIDLKPEHAVVEIGAYTGTLSCFAAKEYGVKHVYAIEASKKNFEILSRNCRHTVVCPMNIAIGDTDGTVSFIEYENLPSSNSLIQSNAVYSRDAILENKDSLAKPVHTEVQSMTLASFMSRMAIGTIDLLLMNCEGAETFILPQIVQSPEMMDKIRTVSIEFHPTLLGQKQVMKLILLLLPYYQCRIITRSLRGPLNVIFQRRVAPAKPNLQWAIRYMRASLMDTVWPMLALAKRVKDKLIPKTVTFSN